MLAFKTKILCESLETTYDEGNSRLETGYSSKNKKDENYYMRCMDNYLANYAYIPLQCITDFNAVLGILLHKHIFISYTSLALYV